jgi:hypothetical protein
MRPLNVGPLGLKRDVGNGKDSGQKPRRFMPAQSLNAAPRARVYDWG